MRLSMGHHQATTKTGKVRYLACPGTRGTGSLGLVYSYLEHAECPPSHLSLKPAWTSRILCPSWVRRNGVWLAFGVMVIRVCTSNSTHLAYGFRWVRQQDKNRYESTHPDIRYSSRASTYAECPPSHLMSQTYLDIPNVLCPSWFRRNGVCIAFGDDDAVFGMS